MDEYCIFRPMVSGGSREPMGGSWSCEVYKPDGDDMNFELTQPVDSEIASVYPFLFDADLKITVELSGTYLISRAGATERIIMSKSIVDDYIKSRLPTEVIGWCAMYDCLTQRSEILKSYYPLDK